MEECALIMTEPVGSIALAHHNILVNAVKLIGVVPWSAKMMEGVLLLLLTISQYQNANAPKIMLEKLVTLIFALISNVEVVLVLVEPVNVIQIISISIILVKKHVR